MALRLRRGTNAERLLVTPVEGELVYTTDTKLIFAGDGATIGGNLIAGLGSVLADAAPKLGANLDINSKNITGIGNINIDGTITAPQFEGNIHADDSTIAYNSATQRLSINDLEISGDVVITESTNKLDVYSSHASTSSNIVLNRSKGAPGAPTALVDTDNIFGISLKGHTGASYTGGASIVSDVDGTVTSTIMPADLQFKITNTSGQSRTPLRIRSDGKVYMAGGDIVIQSANITAFGSGNSGSGSRSFKYYRSRGSDAAPTANRTGDAAYQHQFHAYDGSNFKRIVNLKADVGSATIGAGVISGRYRVRVTNNTGVESTLFDIKGAENQVRVYGDFDVPQNKSTLGDVNIFQNRIYTETSNQDLEIQAAGTGDVVVTGGLRSDSVHIEGNTIKTVDSNAPLELSASGTGIVSAVNLTAINYMQLPVYADDAARGSAISSPNAGMIIFNTTGTKFQGYTGAAWVDLN